MPSIRTPDAHLTGASRVVPEPSASPGPPRAASSPGAAASPGLPGPPGAGGAAGVRLIEVPGAWPPYDCETHGAACPAAREAAGLGPMAHGPLAPEPAAGPGPGPAAGWAGAGPAGTPATGALGVRTPGAGAAAPAGPRQFALVLVEFLAGVRPSRQLVPWTTEHVRAQIVELGQALAADQRDQRDRRVRRDQPDLRPRVRRVVTSRPTADVAEVTVVISYGPRSRAMAMRFEHRPARPPGPGRPGRPARWLCTAIETGCAMLRHQDHLAFGGELAAADLAGVFEGFQRPEGAMIGAQIRHVVVVLVAEIDDFLEIRLHGLTPPCCRHGLERRLVQIAQIIRTTRRPPGLLEPTGM